MGHGDASGGSSRIATGMTTMAAAATAPLPFSNSNCNNKITTLDDDDDDNTLVPRLTPILITITLKATATQRILLNGHDLDDLGMKRIFALAFCRMPRQPRIHRKVARRHGTPDSQQLREKDDDGLSQCASLLRPLTARSSSK